jgi:DNA-binding response OmpR family regulator
LLLHNRAQNEKPHAAITDLVVRLSSTLSDMHPTDARQSEPITQENVMNAVRLLGQPRLGPAETRFDSVGSLTAVAENDGEAAKGLRKVTRLAVSTACANGANADLSKIGHILIVDDDPAIRETVTGHFADHNVPTSSVANRSEVGRHLASMQPSLIILDLHLGEDDGFDVLRSIRACSDVPVIIVTGHRPEEIDRIVGLELGADDYVVKPFSMRELLARVRAVLRRQEIGRVARAHDPERGGYRFEGWQLERRGRRLVDPGGVQVPLSRGEYTLLLAFLEAPQRALSREQLLQATRIHEDIFDRSIDVQVMRLRRKLEIDSTAPRAIRTEHGIGYVFAPRVESF